MSTTSAAAIWVAGGAPPAFTAEGVAAAAGQFRQAAHIVRDPRNGTLGIGLGGRLWLGSTVDDRGAAVAGYPLVGSLPALYPEWLGDRDFTHTHGLRFPYVAGEMANGIASTQLVVSMARHGMLGFFGAAGLPLAKVEGAIDEIERVLGPAPAAPPWGANLIHSPAEPAVEDGWRISHPPGRARICASASWTSLQPCSDAPRAGSP